MKPSVSRQVPTKSKLPVKLSVSGRDADLREDAEIASILTPAKIPAKSVPAEVLQQLADDRLRHFASFR